MMDSLRSGPAAPLDQGLIDGLPAMRRGGFPAPVAAAGLLMLAGAWASVAQAAEPKNFLSSIHRKTTLTSTVPANGDQNPYAIVVAPASAGAIDKGDILVTNFNNDKNLQGLGTTIVRFRPSTKQLAIFAELPRHLPECPGGVGLTTAMTMLKSGWVIVGQRAKRGRDDGDQRGGLPARPRSTGQGRERA